eukprot:3747434-Rhodomonas_salina.1
MAREGMTGMPAVPDMYAKTMSETERGCGEGFGADRVHLPNPWAGFGHWRDGNHARDQPRPGNGN